MPDIAACPQASQESMIRIADDQPRRAGILPHRRIISRLRISRARERWR